MEKRYDLLVLGAGITGCEAALSAVESGAEVLLLDMSVDCLNLPGHLPALLIGSRGSEDLYGRLEGTLFAKALETSYMGCFELPYSGERMVLFDRREHSLASKDILEKEKHLDIRQALIKSMKIEEEIQVKSIFDEVFSAEAAIISPGYYIKGRIKSGKMELKAGRYGDLSSEEMEKSLRRNGVKLREWTGYSPETVDTRLLDYENWNKTAETNPSFNRKREFTKMAQDSPVLWRKRGEGHQLLIPLGPHGSEAYLLEEGMGPPENCVETRKALVRRGFRQESLILEGGGSGLPASVALAGSFAGETGYLDCISSGRGAASMLLKKG
jgi:tRNA U34 5-carboxymethylaminomethyl modifying enzyme MnmG/GidA